MLYSYLVVLLLSTCSFAAQSQRFSPPSLSPYTTTANYTGPTNGSLPVKPVVRGKVFDRFIQIWLENTDFEAANATAEFRALAETGILMDHYYSLTHPSQPNYVAAIGGDFWGMSDDSFYGIDASIPTQVDLLEAERISWASYQENMPCNGYSGFSFKSTNYIDPSKPPYMYYARKHNPTIIYDSIANIAARLLLHRNFNDFAADINASAIPQWVFVTPNLVNDAHDTTIDFAGEWLRYWLVPLLDDLRFNDANTLILLTFDENENYKINNRVFSLLLGGVVPDYLRGTVDSTYYTHYSTMSTVQANWGLGSLGRHDTDPIMANVFSLVADAVGYQNKHVSDLSIPLTNLTGTIPGPLNPRPDLFAPYPAPNTSAIGAGGGPVLDAPTLSEVQYVVDFTGSLGARLSSNMEGFSGAAYIFPVLFIAAMCTMVVLARKEHNM